MRRALLSPFQFLLYITSTSLFMVPGSKSPLQKFCLNESDMLLVYEDGLARLWDVKTREFRRSTTTEKAEELLVQNTWLTWWVFHQVFTVHTMSHKDSGRLVNGSSDAEPSVIRAYKASISADTGEIRAMA